MNGELSRYTLNHDGLSKERIYTMYISGSSSEEGWSEVTQEIRSGGVLRFGTQGLPFSRLVSMVSSDFWIGGRFRFLLEDLRGRYFLQSKFQLPPPSTSFPVQSPKIVCLFDTYLSWYEDLSTGPTFFLSPRSSSERLQSHFFNTINLPNPRTKGLKTPSFTEGSTNIKSKWMKSIVTRSLITQCMWIPTLF